ncbi:MAG TPA: MarR family transcriptional regulator [Gemmatimonadales bacterium]|nr:MarR family transcriptional regulator [Gemmatimonadales bacterium]
MSSRLQAELKQTRPFPSRGTEALLSILRTAAVLEHQLGEVLKPFGLTPTQHNVLRILRGAGSAGLCGREIGERLVASVPDVPRLLERMEALRLISRERDAADRRHVTARITPKGLELLARVAPELAAVEHARVRELSDAELTALIDGLAAVRAAGAAAGVPG